jgi:putative transposase
MLIAHKIALNPNKKQRDYFARAAGTARFAWNWALGEWQAEHKAGGKPSEVALRRKLNGLKREQFPWMYDVSKCAVQESLIDLGTAFNNFFRDCKKPKAQRHFGYPKFKSRDARRSFCAANEAKTFRVFGKKIALPVVGTVRMREELRFTGKRFTRRHGEVKVKPKRVTVSFEAGRWFASIQVEIDGLKPATSLQDTVGIDLGVNTLAALACIETGSACAEEGPKALKKSLLKLRRANKCLARKQKKSKNRFRAKLRLQKVHARIANQRKDATHKLTTKAAKTYRVVGIEDLNVTGMASGNLAKSVMDQGFYEIRRQLEYKCRWYGSTLIAVGRYYPSSKICSCCGVVKDHLPRAKSGTRNMFECDDCGFVCDRDINAAFNIAREASRIVAASSAVTVCGERRSGPVRKPRVKRRSVKQEETMPNLEAT